MKILITGNREKDLTGYLVPLLEDEGHEVFTASRENGYDFEDPGCIKWISKLSDNYDVFINMYANFHFEQSMLLHTVWHRWAEQKQADKRIINLGSTTDTVRRGKSNLYHYEKLALNEMSNGLGIIGNWQNAPKVSHISFGTLSNKQHKHEDRTTIPLETAAKYIKWILDQPTDLNINTLSIDPIQNS